MKTLILFLIFMGVILLDFWAIKCLLSPYEEWALLIVGGFWGIVLISLLIIKKHKKY